MTQSWLRLKIVIGLSVFSTLLGFNAQSAPLSSAEFNRAIESGIEKVTEFRAIGAEAQRLGIRVWLFGGTAAGFGHYVRWDLLRQGGDTRFTSNRFDYDYTNIYRSTQDLDIVIDGTPAQAKKFQEYLEAYFPFFQGSKPAWEVRTLQSQIGDKEALLRNPNYLNQSNDSNSTGLIELTPPSRADQRIRDLRDWNAADSKFAKDIRLGQITYYDSPLHETTARYQSAKNPRILSVIRYLIKVAQYGLEPQPQDLVTIKTIIDQFQSTDIQPGYLSQWVEKNAKKLMNHAIDIEKTWNLLESLGLRKKLIAIRNNPEEERSLAWWLSREPLRSFPVGQGQGATAKSLGLSELAHGTNDFATYEAISISKSGEANFLISRKGAVGETASFGNGVYTSEGRIGAKGNGFTVRLRLNPEAREGMDFKRVRSGILILNKSAVDVIPESLTIDPVQWFEMLASGRSFDESDQGIIEMVRRRVSYKLYSPSDEADAKISEIIRTELSKSKLNAVIFKEWQTIATRLKHLSEAEAWTFIKKALQNPETRFLAAQQLIRFSNPEVLQEIENILNRPLVQSTRTLRDFFDLDRIAAAEAAVRVEAIQALKNRPEPQAEALLRKAVQSESPAIRTIANHTLGLRSLNFPEASRPSYGEQSSFRPCLQRQLDRLLWRMGTADKMDVIRGTVAVSAGVVPALGIAASAALSIHYRVKRTNDKAADTAFDLVDWGSSFNEKSYHLAYFMVRSSPRESGLFLLKYFQKNPGKFADDFRTQDARRAFTKDEQTTSYYVTNYPETAARVLGQVLNESWEQHSGNRQALTYAEWANSIILQK